MGNPKTILPLLVALAVILVIMAVMADRQKKLKEAEAALGLQAPPPVYQPSKEQQARDKVIRNGQQELDRMQRERQERP